MNGITVLCLLLCAVVFPFLVLQITLRCWKHFVKKYQKEMSFHPKVVTNYAEPRFVYENQKESIDYTKENGRIIGYRIAPDLVINSHIYQNVNPSTCDGVFRSDLLELDTGDDVERLHNSLEALSRLRKKSGQSSLNLEWIWIKRTGTPVLINIKTFKTKPWDDHDKYPVIVKYANL